MNKDLMREVIDYRVKQVGANSEYIYRLIKGFGGYKKVNKIGCIGFVLLWMGPVDNLRPDPDRILKGVNARHPRELRDVKIGEFAPRYKFIEKCMSIIINYGNPIVEPLNRC